MIPVLWQMTLLHFRSTTAGILSIEISQSCCNLAIIYGASGIRFTVAMYHGSTYHIVVATDHIYDIICCCRTQTIHNLQNQRWGAVGTVHIYCHNKRSVASTTCYLCINLFQYLPTFRTHLLPLGSGMSTWHARYALAIDHWIGNIEIITNWNLNTSFLLPATS
jgi:hypothetical protein